MLDFLPNDSVKTVSELVQLSVAPVFMLAGIAGFLNVSTGRLARIVDRLEIIVKFKEECDGKCPKAKQLSIDKRHKTLLKRMKNINYSIIFFTATGLLIAMVMMSMFLGAIFGFHGAFFISMLFILSTLSLILALGLFLREIFFTVTSIGIEIMP